MHAAEGILTARGGMTSHAAVVARGWGKPCVCGCEALRVDNGSKTATLGGEALKQGDWISVNGSTGEVLRGKQELKPPELAGVCGGGGGGRCGLAWRWSTRRSFHPPHPPPAGDMAEFMSWVDEFRKIGVWANADTPADAAIARRNGAQGIGLVRTEHMFFASAERIAAVRRMIAAEELDTGASA